MTKLARPTASTSTSTSTSTISPTPPKTLTIRNLTAEPISLVLVEFLRPPSATNPTRQSVFGAIASLIWRADDDRNNNNNIDSNNSSSSDEGHASHPLSAIIPPYTTHATSLAPGAGGGSLRITLLSGTQPHRFQVSIPSAPRAAPVANLDGSPGAPEALYLAGPACVCILAPGDLTCWMQTLRDELPLSTLSIPGTHNSPTCHVALPSVRCQAVSIKTQLHNGIRFLDVRVSTSRHQSAAAAAAAALADDHHHHHHHHGRHPLHLVHGPFSVSLVSSRRLADLLADVYAFLDAHPSETIILSLKREGLGWGTDADLCRRLREVYCAARPERWYTDTRIPTLGESRGRIVLLRRFVLDEATLDQVDATTTNTGTATTTTEGHPSSDERVENLHRKLGWGASGDGWPDNVEDGIVGGGHIRIQDYYGIMARGSIRRKIRASRVALELAASQRYALVGQPAAEAVTLPPPMFINFLSGSNFFNPGCWPERIAAKVNPATLEYLCVRHGEHARGPNGLDVGDGSTGVVVADWVGMAGDWDLVKCIVTMNGKLRLQDSGQHRIETV